MSKHEPIDPSKLSVGDTVEWVEKPDVWDVEIKDIREYGIIVDSGYGKTALFGPSKEDASKYVLLVGDMEMDDYLRLPKAKKDKKNKKAKESSTADNAADGAQPAEPEKFKVGETIEWVESDGTVWDETVLSIDVDCVTVSCSWDKKVFLLRDGQYVISEGAADTGWVDSYIRRPKKKDKKAKK